ncbi:MAG: carbohydrate ABC transporter permease [Xylanivirga thermophila]|nr:carbohydrate ABC transporter permease [Xylanivirga thermophila]
MKKEYRPNALGPVAEVIFNIILALFSLSCIIPFIFIVIISFTDEMALAEYGYSFFPKKTTMEAYKYIFKTGELLGRSYGVSVVITVVGTILTLIITSMYAYALYRKDYKFRGFFTFIAFFTMLFGGGLVPFYITMTQLLKLRDSIWALIMPMCLNAFHIIVLRTFFTTTIPDSLIDAAAIDGSGEFRTFLQIILPISLPGIATIGLFTTLAYWNDWFNAMLFIDNPNLIPVQYLLMKIENRMEFIIQNATKMTSSEASSALKSLPRESARMAMVVLVVLPIAAAYPFFQQFFIQGLTIGSVKG